MQADHDLGAGHGQKLPGPNIEWHPLPAPRIDEEPHRGKGFHLRVLRHAFLLAVSPELPADQVRVGQRVDAVWASPAEETEEGGGMGGSWGSLLGWIPNGEPDLADPDLVNRIF